MGLRLGIPPSPRFCATAECPVVYFDNTAGVIFEEALLTVPVHAKHRDNQDVPVCYCFGHTPRSIRESQVRDGAASVSKAITGEVRAGHCACEVKNPEGVCCLGDVVRIESMT